MHAYTQKHTQTILHSPVCLTCRLCRSQGTTLSVLLYCFFETGSLTNLKNPGVGQQPASPSHLLSPPHHSRRRHHRRAQSPSACYMGSKDMNSAPCFGVANDLIHRDVAPGFLLLFLLFILFLRQGPSLRPGLSK